MADEAGLATFVGRVRGQLDPSDIGWVNATSDAVSAMRLDLVAASHRLERLQADIDDVGSAADHDQAAGDDGPTDEPWARLVARAARINAALVELAGRRRLPASSIDPVAVGAIAAEQALHAVSERALDLGRLLQEVRGEQVVDELLTAGVLVAPPGTTGSVAFAEHGAWDIEFLGSGGTTIARADVRITSDPTELLESVAARPGVDLVYTTSDAADGLVGSDAVTVVRPGDVWPSDASGVVVVDVGVDSTALHADLLDTIGAGAESTADALLEAVPVLALFVVGVRAAARASTTDDPGSDIATATWQQTKDVVTTAGVSELVGWASGLNLIKVPVTLTFALSRSAVRDARSSVELSGRRVARARRLIAGVAGT